MDTSLDFPLQHGELRFEWVAPEAVDPNERNWRTHPDEQTNSLRELIFADGGVGWAGVVLVNLRHPDDGWEEADSHPTLIDGHDRRKIAIQASSPMPALIGRWTPQEERLILQTLDPIAMMATVDNEKLADLAQLVAQEIKDNLQGALAASLEAIGFELPSDGGGSGSDAEPLFGEADELVEKWEVQEGQVWQIGEHRIMCGDSTKHSDYIKLMDGRLVDMMLTDPPYGVAYEDNKEGESRTIANDALEDYVKFFSEFLAVPVFSDYNTVYIFMQGKRYAELSQAMAENEYFKSMELVWVKNMPVMGRQDYNNQHELIVYGWKGKHRFYGVTPHSIVLDEEKPIEELSKAQLVELLNSVRATADVIRHDKNSKNDLHPTMKPIGLLEKLMKDGCDTGALVYDPFLGSGSTMVAAQNLNRVCYGIELDKRYVAVAIQRMVDLTGGGIKPKLVDDVIA